MKDLFRTFLFSGIMFAQTGMPHAQDIGLLAGQDAYVALRLQKKFSNFESAYSGHITTFDKLNGFEHAELNGRITDLPQNHLAELGRVERLKFELSSDYKFPWMASEFERKTINSNTSWVNLDSCSSCVNLLNGTTFEQDKEAVNLVNYYEKNISKRSRGMRDFLAGEAAKNSLCDFGEKEFCIAQGIIGVVLPRSEAGVAKLVASAIGTEARIATFSNNEFDGAMVAVSPSVVKTISKSVGPTLTDGVLDFNEWKVVAASQYETPHLHLINLDISEKLSFFATIGRNPGDIDRINEEMTELFSEITKESSNCSYDVYNNNPYFTCYNYSADLGASEKNGAWIRSQAFMSTVQIGQRVKVIIHIYFSLKYNQRTVSPIGKFDPVRYNNDDESFIVRLAEARIAKSFQKVFSPFITIVR